MFHLEFLSLSMSKWCTLNSADELYAPEPRHDVLRAVHHRPWHASLAAGEVPNRRILVGPVCVAYDLTNPRCYPRARGTSPRGHRRLSTVTACPSLSSFHLDKTT
jgi:hypothetical protein